MLVASERSASVVAAVTLAVALAVVTGCTPRRPFTAPSPGATAANTIDVDGRTRTYRLHEGDTGGAPPRALLVVLHGGGGDSRSMARVSGLDRVADREGFAVAYADGLGIMGWAQMWNAGHCCGRPQMLGVDDVAFVRALVFELSSRLRVPTDRVFLVGYSNGALLAYRAGSALSDRIGGIVVFAGTMRAHGPRDAPVFELPPPRRPISVMSVHGTRDNRIAYRGSLDGAFVDVSFEQAGRFWAVGAGCRERPAIATERAGAVRVAAYRGCPPGASVVQITLVGWNHEWPGHTNTDDLPASDPLRGFELADFIGAFIAGELRARR